MGYSFSTYLTVKNRDEFRRVLESAQGGFDYDTEKLELSWTGETCCEKAESVVAHFPDIEFKICDSWDLGAKYGLSENGKIRWLELSDDVNEMMDWGIDVDPYVGPTPENWEALRQHRRTRVQEMIDLGVHISIDTWPPSKDQLDEEHKLRYGDEQCIKYKIWSDSDDFMFNDDDVVNMIADEYADIGLSKVELLESGKDGMTKAREHYDVKEHGSCFYAYADSWVRQAIFQAIGTKLALPTTENSEELQRHTREIVQEMIDLGIKISVDTWPPSKEQLDEEYRLRCINNNESKMVDNEERDNPDLPF